MPSLPSRNFKSRLHHFRDWPQLPCPLTHQCEHLPNRLNAAFPSVLTCDHPAHIPGLTPLNKFQKPSPSPNTLPEWIPSHFSKRPFDVSLVSSPAPLPHPSSQLLILLRFYWGNGLDPSTASSSHHPLPASPCAHPRLPFALPLCPRDEAAMSLCLALSRASPLLVLRAHLFYCLKPPSGILTFPFLSKSCSSAHILHFLSSLETRGNTSSVHIFLWLPTHFWVSLQYHLPRTVCASGFQTGLVYIPTKEFWNLCTLTHISNWHLKLFIASLIVEKR